MKKFLRVLFQLDSKGTLAERLLCVYGSAILVCSFLWEHYMDAVFYIHDNYMVEQ